MVWDRIAGSWQQLIGIMQEKWGKWTDNDLLIAAGKRDQLDGRLQKKYGYKKTPVEKDLDASAATLRTHAAREFQEFSLKRQL